MLQLPGKAIEHITIGIIVRGLHIAYSEVELCADVIVSAAARRSILVGVALKSAAVGHGVGGKVL